jgi:hypothetical protein
VTVESVRHDPPIVFDWEELTAEGRAERLRTEARHLGIEAALAAERLDAARLAHELALAKLRHETIRVFAVVGACAAGAVAWAIP